MKIGSFESGSTTCSADMIPFYRGAAGSCLTPIFSGVTLRGVSSDLEGAARSIGSLANQLRRRMYLFIRRREQPVSREEAAAEVGISTKLAAFHLDKLVDEGLLKAHYARLPGRSGPGAGRSSKLYEPTDRSFEVSLPPRAYDLVGQLLLTALETKTADESPDGAARRVGYGAGLETGRTVASRSPHDIERVLADLGFEPRPETGRILLANCPFHALAQNNPALVCGLNEAFLAGVVDGTGEAKRAVLHPEAGRCCVVLEEVDSA